ncbi:MAG TPA: response regulator [Solirubrobacteraceae bacterium]|nr:response regulator [Solirubrobacteraceae bacterium]
MIDQLLRRRSADATRVLVVDDDVAVLSAVETLLSAHGVEATTLDDPLGLWGALEALDPDLVVLDVDMPAVSGIELCRVIRNEPRWSRLPVLFLTARTDPDTVQAVFAAGADDYVPKPVLAPELLTRITNRVERVALYRSLSDIDALTGVATRRTATERLERMLSLARRGQALALAVIDLDHFKQVNDEHGHAAGDRVLQRVGALLQATFRGEDIVARWGGEEFAVGLSASGTEDAARRLEHTLEVLRRERFAAADGRSFTVTFTAGVAGHPGDAEDLQGLFAAADAALYQAKNAGRDRVLLAGPRPRIRAQRVDVVIVEDDPALSALLSDTLGTAGLSVRTIADGQSAVEALSGPEPALRARVALLDVDLPGMDGLTVLRRLAADRVLRGTRIVMLTARSAEVEVVTALELGAFDHVAKPFSLPILLQRVRRALESMP